MDYYDTENLMTVEVSYSHYDMNLSVNNEQNQNPDEDLGQISDRGQNEALPQDERYSSWSCTQSPYIESRKVRGGHPVPKMNRTVELRNEDAVSKDLGDVTTTMLSDYQNNISSLTNSLAEQQLHLKKAQQENCLLRELHVRQEKVLDDYSKMKTTMSELAMQHEEEINALREELRQSKENERIAKHHFMEADTQLRRKHDQMLKLQNEGIQLIEETNELACNLKQEKFNVLGSKCKVKELEQELRMTRVGFERGQVLKQKKSYYAQHEFKRLFKRDQKERKKKQDTEEVHINEMHAEASMQESECVTSGTSRRSSESSFDDLTDDDLKEKLLVDYIKMKSRMSELTMQHEKEINALREELQQSKENELMAKCCCIQADTQLQRQHDQMLSLQKHTNQLLEERNELACKLKQEKLSVQGSESKVKELEKELMLIKVSFERGQNQTDDELKEKVLVDYRKMKTTMSELTMQHEKEINALQEELLHSKENENMATHHFKEADTQLQREQDQMLKLQDHTNQLLEERNELARNLKQEQLNFQESECKEKELEENLRLTRVDFESTQATNQELERLLNEIKMQGDTEEVRTNEMLADASVQVPESECVSSGARK